jgi:PleD family two-component response regulator
MNEKSQSFDNKQLTKIFVVDDSELSRHNIVKLLENENYNVVGQAEGAKDCLSQLGTDPNLFIIDVVMPQTSGIELAKLLTENRKNIYIIMISSLTQEHVLLESISAGAKDFLVKPFNEKDLIASVEKLSENIRKNQIVAS